MRAERQTIISMVSVLLLLTRHLSRPGDSSQLPMHNSRGPSLSGYGGEHSGWAEAPCRREGAARPQREADPEQHPAPVL
eukprot:9488652-Pyramimonas_sp.AAC.1